MVGVWVPHLQHKQTQSNDLDLLGSLLLVHERDFRFRNPQQT